MTKCPLCKKTVTLKESTANPQELGVQRCHFNCYYPESQEPIYPEDEDAVLRCEELLAMRKK